MTENTTTRTLRPVVIVPYRPEWQSDFTRLAERIRAAAGDAALRIDHVGSTAVEGLAAKDVVDIQVTVADLDDAPGITEPLRRAGWRRGEGFVYDLFHTLPKDDPELRKLYMREPDGERRCHLHIRERGRFNQRFALLFRDFLRASDRVRAEYELLKRRAAAVYPYDIDGYLLLKDPVFHIIFEAASLWAEKVDWSAEGDRRESKSPGPTRT
jgi:GrpB-like predicted nucleotidyltransferase (UPF0157 family)